MWSRRDTRLAALGALIVLGLSCAPSTSPPPAPADSGADAAASAQDWRTASREAAQSLDAGYFDRALRTLADDALEGRQNNSPGGAAARSFIISSLRGCCLPVHPDGFGQPFPEGVNVVLERRGSDPELRDEYVLLSAHYDHLGTADDGLGQCERDAETGDGICNGAADNAAGVAAVLTIVEALQRVELRRSLLVILWDAEEDGLLGSRYFVEEEPLVPLEDIVAMFSVDIVGARIFPGADVAFALGMDYSEGLRELLHDIGDELGPGLFPVSMSFSGGEGGRSDHKPFQEAGVPVVFFGSGSPPEYHSPRDEIEVVDTPLALMLMRHVLLATAELANADGRPSYVQGPSPHLDDARALRDLGQRILADPAAAGLDNALLIEVVEQWVADLSAWLAKPPETQAQWDEYQALVDEILLAVYTFI